MDDLLDKKERILQVVQEEAEKIAQQYGNDRRTAIVSDEGQAELKDVDFIPNTPSIVSYSRKGYIKRMRADTFTVQGVRGQGEYFFSH